MEGSAVTAYPNPNPGVGLTVPGDLPVFNSPSRGVSVGGILNIKSGKQLMEEAQAEDAKVQQMPVLTGIAAHIKQCWTVARMAKMQTVEPRMLQALRQRRGEYDPEKLADIREQGGSEIYMMITSSKCRGASAWVRDVLLSSDDEKPWTLSIGPLPDLTPDVVQDIMKRAQKGIMQQMQAGGDPSDQDVRQMLLDMREEAESRVRDAAQDVCDKMEDKIEQQLDEGGFVTALSEFIDDLTTFPSAILKGPVLRNKARMTWKQVRGKWQAVTEMQIVKEVERVDPFNIYPAPNNAGVDDGYLIERHRMSRQDLQDLMGVEGYNESAIRMVLDEYGVRGLQDWLWTDTAKAVAEGKSTYGVLSSQTTSVEIDALQFWGGVQGQMLLDWGMSPKEIKDPTAEYHVEAWLIGGHVIKAVLNYHPEGKRPYYKLAWEEIPGLFWGNSVADLVRDTQAMANAAARSLANNMALASGPQVGYNVQRMPSGEDVTQMYPWKVWQFTSDPYGSTAPAIEFFQPDSQAVELMAVYEKFSALADEYSGIPRYMMGEAPQGEVGRTASGISMMMGNATKSIKNVIAHMDVNVIRPLVQRYYYYNMKYDPDESIKAVLNIQARGATALMTKESAQIRRTEFLAATANPIDMQIVGVEGRAAILRQTAKTLDMNADDVVPPLSQLKVRLAEQAMLQNAQGGPTPGGAPGGPTLPPGKGPIPSTMANNQTLMNGAPTTDHFSPSAH